MCAAAADDCSEFALPRHTRKGLVFNLTLLYGFGCCSVLLPPPCLLVATFMHGVVTLGTQPPRRGLRLTAWAHTGIRGTEVLTGRISAQHFLGCTGDWGLAAALFAAHATPVLERAALTLAGVLFLLIGLINMSVRALRRVQL